MSQMASFAEPNLRVGHNWAKAAWVSAAILVTYLVAGPVLMLLFSSLRSTQQKLPFEATQFTLVNYIRVFGSNATYDIMLNTLFYGSGSLALALVLTITFSWILERTNVICRPFLLVAILTPMAFPGIIGAMAWVMLANPSNGLFNLALREIFALNSPGPLNIYSIPGMIVVTGLQLVPSMYLMISGTFSRLDPSLEEASYISGVKPSRTFLHISIPLLRPGILSATIYYFILSIEMFEIPGLLGLPKGIFVLSTAIYEAVHPIRGALPNYGLASGYGMVTLVLGIALIYMYAWSVRHRKHFEVVTGKGYRPRLINIGRWRYLIPIIVLIYLAFSIIIPVLTLFWASLLPFYQVPSVTALARISMANYLALLRAPAIMQAALNTAFAATVTATVVMMLATILEWRSIRYASWYSRFPDRITFIAFGAPSVVIGLALMFIYLSIPIPIYSTIWIIIVGFVTRFITYSTRVMNAAFLQIHPELEEASYMSKVPWWPTIRRVVLPLVWPSFLRGWLWAFVQSVREVTLAVMLVGVGNETFSARLWMDWLNEGNIAFSAAQAMIIVFFLSIITFVIGRSTMFREQIKKGH